jgi:hypothetical protein
MPTLHRWRSFLFGHRRPETQQEADLRNVLAERYATIRQLRTDNQALQSSLEVRELECRLLAEVVESNRRRVQAEQMSDGLALVPAQRRPVYGEG